MTAIYLREATELDLGDILNIIAEARETLFNNGIPQWQNGEGPSQAVLQTDIQKKQAYVLIVEDRLVGVGIISDELETAYEQLQGGEWLNYNSPSPYAAIHRVAIGSNYHGKGYALLLLRYLITAARLKKILDIRIDTHPKNKAMQHLISKAGFDYRGDILLSVTNGERHAYQLVLS